jgi:sorbitol-specific phosphotransferase system component IIA
MLVAPATPASVLDEVGAALDRRLRELGHLRSRHQVDRERLGTNRHRIVTLP